MGGESGFSAASSFRNCEEVSSDAVEVDGVEDEGESRKVMNPNASRAARTRVIGFVRRRVTTAIVSGGRIKMRDGCKLGCDL